MSFTMVSLKLSALPVLSYFILTTIQQSISYTLLTDEKHETYSNLPVVTQLGEEP